jgi:hypothetical protein
MPVQANRRPNQVGKIHILAMHHHLRIKPGGSKQAVVSEVIRSVCACTP